MRVFILFLILIAVLAGHCSATTSPCGIKVGEVESGFKRPLKVGEIEASFKGTIYVGEAESSFGCKFGC